jgi:hypothetical protein
MLTQRWHVGRVRSSTRIGLALAVGLFGFLLYLGGVMALADLALTLHWTVQALFFVLAGVAWVWPARRLMRWAAAAGDGSG